MHHFNGEQMFGRALILSGGSICPRFSMAGYTEEDGEEGLEDSREGADATSSGRLASGWS